MTSPKNHILIITHNFPQNLLERKNAGIFIYDLAKEISKKNKVSIMAPGQRNEVKIFKSIKIYYFKWKGETLGSLRIWRIADWVKLVKFFYQGIKTLNKIFANNKPDKVLAMWAFPGGLFAYYLRKKYRLDYLVWVLGSDIYVYSKIFILGSLIVRILNNSKKIIADSINLKETTEQLTNKKSQFIPSSTNFAFSKASISKVKKKIVITFLGRLEKVKGPDILIDALIKISSNLENFKINIIGDGSLMLGLRDEAKKNELKSVKFFGAIENQKEIYSILASSDWVVIPSRSDSIPLVFSEAMKAGTPVITSDLNDFKYLMKKYKVGLLFKNNDSNYLANILVNLKKEDSNYKIFQKNTLTAAYDFSIESSVSQLLKII